MGGGASLEEGGPATSHKCMVFFLVKALPLNQIHVISLLSPSSLSQSFLLPLKANSQGFKFFLLPGSLSICVFVCL